MMLATLKGLLRQMKLEETIIIVRMESIKKEKMRI